MLESLLQNEFVVIGIMFIGAFFFKVLFDKINVPDVTGYVVVGIILGVSLTHLLSEEVVESLDAMNEAAIGLISILIGMELKWSVIKRLGISIISIVFFECFGAFILVTGGTYFFFPDKLPLALLLGAVAAATAPAATIAVIQQLKARGVLTSTIMAVVGIDDALSLMIYAFAASFAFAMLGGGHPDLVAISLHSVEVIVTALVVGAVSGIVVTLLLKRIHQTEIVYLAMVGSVAGLIGVANVLGVSDLLTIMMFGAIIANRDEHLTHRTEEIAMFLTPLLLPAFFILGGARLDLSVFTEVAVLASIFFIGRTVGKIAGGNLGAVVSGADSNVKKYVGFALLPQVGVGLALALSIQKILLTPEYSAVGGKDMGNQIINVLLFTTIITEVVGPLATAFVLKLAKEAHGGDKQKQQSNH